MLAVVELAAMVATLAGVPDEPPGRDRRGRPWRSIALEAWGMDVLRERSFLWFVGARLLILMASGVLLNLLPFYLARCFAMDRDAAGGAILLLSAVGAFTNAATVVPAARLSDRIGRKRTITISCAIGTTSLLVCALAPAFPVAVAGVVLYGIATGMFLSVDWALLSDLVPRIASGRYMGISNVASALSGILVVAAGGAVMDLVGGPTRDPAGPRASLVLGALAFVAGAALLRRVREPSRRTREALEPAQPDRTADPAL